MSDQPAPCFVCAKREHVGTQWTATGNYPSAVWDPMHERRYLLAWICDECLKERADRVVTIVPGPVQQKNEAFPGIVWE